MIIRIKYERKHKTETFAVPDADIDSGAYRDLFESAFRKLAPTDDYRVSEWYRKGLIIDIPLEKLSVEEQKPFMALPTFDSPSAKLSIKEVFNYAETGRKNQPVDGDGVSEPVKG